MIDVDLIQQCADPRLEVAIVQQSVAEMNAPDHLTIREFHGEKMFLVPAPKSAEQAVETTRRWVDQANVRVGLTQYPAGLGVSDTSEIGLELFDTCENLRLGTELFGNVLRIVGERDEEGEASGFETAVQEYFTGWFAGEQVFYAEEPDRPVLAKRCRLKRTYRQRMRSATPLYRQTPISPEFGSIFQCWVDSPIIDPITQASLRIKIPEVG